MQMVLDLLQNFQGGIRRTISTLGKLMCSGHIVDDSQTGQTDNKDTDVKVHVKIRINLFHKMPEWEKYF